MASFSFNGIKKDYVYMLRGRRRPAWAPRTLNWINVPRMPGAHLDSVEISPRPYDVPIGIEADDIGDLQKIKEDLAEWLLHDEMKELIFEDEPDRTYFAIVDGTLDLEELVRVGKGVITFICAPYKYGPEKEAIFPSDVVSLNYEGTAPGDPIFELEVLQPVTFAMIQNQNDEYMMIGKPVDVSAEPFNKYPVILADELGSTVGWANGSQVDGGIVAGSMTSDGEAFIPSSYGSGSAWHGPALKKSLSKTLANYRIEFYVDFKPVPGTNGRVELYLLDPNGFIIGKLVLADTWKNTTAVIGEVRLGDLTTGKLINHGPWDPKPSEWNDFSGVVMLEKDGQYFRCYITEVDPETGRHYNSRYTTFIDSDNLFSASLASVQLHFGAYGAEPPVESKIRAVKIFEALQESENQIPYIAQPGDVIVFDHVTKDLLINGESRKDLKDFGARYFQLEKGENTLVVYPRESFNVTCKYRERFK